MNEEEIQRRLDVIEKDLNDLDVQLDEFERDMDEEIEKQQKKPQGNKKPRYNGA